MPTSSYLRQALMAATFNGVVWTPPSGWWLALYSTATNDTTGGTEIAGNGYARRSISFTAADVNGIVRNTAEIVFPTAAPNGWGPISYVGIMDALSGGRRLWHGQLSGGETISNAMENVRIPAQALVLLLT